MANVSYRDALPDANWYLNSSNNKSWIIDFLRKDLYLTFEEYQTLRSSVEAVILEAGYTKVAYNTNKVKKEITELLKPIYD